MPPKRKKAEPQEVERGSGRKVRKVVIDSDEEYEEEQAKKEVPISSEKPKFNVDNCEEGEDDVVSEVDVFLLPSDNDPDRTSNMCVGLNRLQFPQQHQQSLSRVFDVHNSGLATKCQAQYKAQVRHLKLRFGDQEEPVEEQPSSSARTPCGIADLLRPLPSQPAPSESTSSHSKKADKGEVFTGEGFSQHGIFSHAVGFFHEGKLFLLPVDKTYEMRKPLAGTSEREVAKTSQKNPSTAGSKTASSSSNSNLSPLRIRFARAENELQRRRREQSSFYKQKLVDNDQWIPLRVEQSKITELYGKQISQATDSQPAEEESPASHQQLSLADLLL